MSCLRDLALLRRAAFPNTRLSLIRVTARVQVSQPTQETQLYIHTHTHTFWDTVTCAVFWWRSRTLMRQGVSLHMRLLMGCMHMDRKR